MSSMTKMSVKQFIIMTGLFSYAVFAQAQSMNIQSIDATKQTLLQLTCATTLQQQDVSQPFDDATRNTLWQQQGQNVLIGHHQLFSCATVSQLNTPGKKSEYERALNELLPAAQAISKGAAASSIPTHYFKQALKTMEGASSAKVNVKNPPAAFKGTIQTHQAVAIEYIRRALKEAMNELAQKAKNDPSGSAGQDLASMQAVINYLNGLDGNGSPANLGLTSGQSAGSAASSAQGGQMAASGGGATVQNNSRSLPSNGGGSNPGVTPGNGGQEDEDDNGASPGDGNNPDDPWNDDPWDDNSGISPITPGDGDSGGGGGGENPGYPDPEDGDDTSPYPMPGDGTGDEGGGDDSTPIPYPGCLEEDPDCKPLEPGTWESEQAKAYMALSASPSPAYSYQEINEGNKACVGTENSCIMSEDMWQTAKKQAGGD